MSTERQAWLERRRGLLGASDVPAILGVDPRRGPLAVYAEKVAGVEAEETLPMRRGRRLEGAIAEEYAEETGRHVADYGPYEITVHPDIPWLGATLDRITCGSVERPAPVAGGDSPEQGPAPAPLQIKLAIGSPAAWKEDAPLAYQVQVQIEIACMRAEWGSLAALVGPGPLAIRDLVRNDHFLASALPVLEEFWSRVQRRDPPEADALPGTTAAIKRLWSDEDGETVPLDQDAVELANQWEVARLRTKDAESQARELENKIRRRLGSASFGALPDGSFLAARLTHVKGYTRVVEPTSYRMLRRFRPRLRRR